MSRSRTAVLFHRLGPYHFARLQAAGRLLPIVALESSGVDATYAWDEVVGTGAFERVTLFEGEDAQHLPKAEVVGRVGAALDKIRPSVVVVPGWADPAALGALRWCLVNHVPAVAMSESQAIDEPRAGWKEAVKRRIIRCFSAALVGGTPHADYIHQLGMPKDRIFLGYDAVDNGYFAAEAAKYRGPWSVVRGQEEKTESEDVAIRGPGSGGSVTGQTDSSSKIQNSKFKIQNSPYFLASNRFIEKKNLFRLLEAYGAYHSQFKIENSKSEVWPLVMLGDGVLKAQLLAHAEKLGLHVIESAPWEESSSSNIQHLKSNIVYFPGFRQIDALPRFYAHAGAFVHASTTEQWGLVVNEAMACGLPVMISNRVGCAQDLVREGVNGFTFDPCDVEQLAQLMLRISAGDFPLAAFGDASRSIISNWGPERFASGLEQAVGCALKVGPKRASVLQWMILKALLIR